MCASIYALLIHRLRWLDRWVKLKFRGLVLLGNNNNVRGLVLLGNNNNVRGLKSRCIIFQECAVSSLAMAPIFFLQRVRQFAVSEALGPVHSLTRKALRGNRILGESATKYSAALSCATHQSVRSQCGKTMALHMGSTLHLLEALVKCRKELGRDAALEPNLFEKVVRHILRSKESRVALVVNMGDVHQVLPHAVRRTVLSARLFERELEICQHSHTIVSCTCKDDTKAAEAQLLVAHLDIAHGKPGEVFVHALYSVGVR